MTTNFFRDQGRKLLANGYRIIPITPGEKRPVSTLTDWPKLLLGPEDLGRFPGAGVGILTGVGPNPIVAIDIDAEDEGLAEQFKQWCFENLGPALVRVGAAPKTLLVYRAAESGWSKGHSATFSDVFGGKNLLEVLSCGQQFVAYHVHPDTGRPYQWVGDGAVDTAAVALTTVTLAQVELAVQAFNDMARDMGLDETSRSRSVKIDVPVVREARSDEDFFGRVNDSAMENLEKWVPALLPSARPYRGGFRVAQVDLGRDYEEDLSILPEGIKDWGVHDIGDIRDGSRTPIDLVMEWGHLTMDDLAVTTAFEAAQWLCEQLGATREDLGFGLRRKREQAVGGDLMRAALAGLRKQVDEAPDMVAIHTTVLPEVKRLLAEFPLLEHETHSIVQAKAKSMSSSITKADFHKLVRQDRVQAGTSIRALTEFGNTERMLDRYGDGLMFVSDISAWYIWNGNNWRKALGGRSEIEHFAKETVRALGSEAGNFASQESEFYNFCNHSQQAKMVANMVRLAESDPRVVVPSSELDKHPHFIGVRNGVVDLRTGQLLAPDPSMRITLTAGAAYDPLAKCPLFERTLSDVFFDDADMVAYVAKAFGYALCGNPKEDIMFIAFGNGANGKSTIFNSVKDTFGAYARAAEAGSFVSNDQSSGAGGAREDLVRLRGARFVYVNEPDENGELKEGVVKSMTGGDTIAARGLYAKDSVEFNPTWTVFMPTNHKPVIKGSDNGIWRRMGMLPFERNFEVDKNIPKDTNRRDKLKDEMPGILALLVRAAIRYKAEGLTPPAKVVAARNAYRTQMDQLAEWLEDCCEVGPDHVCSSKELWESWRDFAYANNLPNYIRSSRALATRLEARFPAGKGTNGTRIRSGIRLKAQVDPF